MTETYSNSIPTRFTSPSVLQIPVPDYALRFTTEQVISHHQPCDFSYYWDVGQKTTCIPTSITNFCGELKGVCCARRNNHL